MDVICFTCGEPWDIHTVLHDEPEGFERKGCLIRACPCCQGQRPAELSSEFTEKLDSLREVAQTFGGDLDGFAGFLEDFLR